MELETKPFQSWLVLLQQGDPKQNSLSVRMRQVCGEPHGEDWAGEEELVLKDFKAVKHHLIFDSLRVSLCCYKETPLVLEARSPRLRYWPIWFLVRAVFLSCRWPLFHCVLTWLFSISVGGERRIFLSSFSYKTTSPTRLGPHPYDLI